MKLLIAFFKDKTREISLYAGTVGIFIVVAFLYNIRMDALKYALLLVIPVISLVVLFTNPYHHFFYTTFSLIPSEQEFGFFYYKPNDYCFVKLNLFQLLF